MLSFTTEEACEKAQAALNGNPVTALRKLRVDGSESAITIRGEVESYYHKQLAQEVVRVQSPGWTIVNAVVVTED